MVKDAQEVKKGTRLVEWDPYSSPIIADASGKVKYQDMVVGKTLDERTDLGTGLTEKVIMESEKAGSGKPLRPHITLVNAKGEVVKNAKNADVRVYLPKGAIVTVNDGQELHEGDVLALIPRESKTKDITGGLPRVSELFEARRPKMLPSLLSKMVEWNLVPISKQNVQLLLWMTPARNIHI